MKLNSKIFITVLTLAPLVLTSCQETSVSTGTVVLQNNQI